jgi:pimeloyl-ACP methyl ester carboxylesterase
MKFYGYIIAFVFACAPLQVSAQKWVDIGSGVANAVEAGGGDSAVILVHGRGGNAQSWFKSDYSDFGTLASNSGLRVVSIGWSGTPGQVADSEIDMAVKYLIKQGAKKISLAGYSAGGGAVAMNIRNRPDGTYHAAVQFSSVDDKPVMLDKTIKIFAFNLRDPCCGTWQSKASKASSDPKEIHELPSGGHPIPTLVAGKADLIPQIVSKLK